MTPQQLKNSILQYAIQGKLVEQRTEEGTAEELYAKIQEEKQKLIAEGKIKKEKPLAPITDKEIPFDIPKSWKWVRLGEIGNWASGCTPSRAQSEYYGNGYPWLKTGDLTDGYIEMIPENITELALQQCSLRLNPVGSVLIAMYGATVGKLGILKFPATTNQACCACIPFVIDNKYLFNFLLSQKSNFIKKGAGGAQPNISKEKIINTVFPLPPLGEQKRIVAKIEELIALADKYADSYLQLEALNKKFPADIQKSILQYAIQGKLVEQRTEEGTAEELYAKIQEEKQKLIKEGKLKKEKPLAPITDKEIPFDIPESWKWCRFCDITDFSLGRTPPRDEAEWWGNDVAWVSISDMSEYGEITNSKEKVTFKALQEKFAKVSTVGTLLMSFKLTVGRTSILKIDAVHNEAIISIFPIYDKSNYFRDFLFYILPIISKWGDSKNAIKGATLNTKSISKMMIPLPPLGEQKRIVAKIEELKAIVKKLE